METDTLSVREAGEDVVLAALMDVIRPHNENVARAHGEKLTLGPGNDDAAVVAFAAQQGGSADVVMTTDTMSEGQDFRREWWDGPEGAADVGIKAAAQNLSDINAMGAAPSALLVSLTLPSDLSVGWVRDFFRGMVRACQVEGAERCVIAGGDLGSGDTISVTITALGQLPPGSRPLRRSGAQPGDTLAIAGQLGYAAAGLALLESSATYSGPVAVECISAQKRPNPTLTAGPAAAAAGATAGMDISDGLLRDAARLASASGVTLELDDKTLTAEAAALEPVAHLLHETSEKTRSWVYAGGEEYALLATFPAGVTLPEGFRRIGHVQEETVQKGKVPPHTDGVPRVITKHAVSESGWNSL